MILGTRKTSLLLVSGPGCEAAHNVILWIFCSCVFSVALHGCRYGWTPLLWAVDAGNTEAARALLEHGADPFVKVSSADSASNSISMCYLVHYAMC